MRLIRLLNIRHYDSKRGRFTSEAFRTFGQGVSVFDADCAEQSSGTICSHIAKFYASTAGDPATFWEFSKEQLPEQAQVVQEESATGDLCHHDIRGLTTKQERSFFLPFSDQFEQFETCPPHGEPLSKEFFDRSKPTH